MQHVVNAFWRTVYRLGYPCAQVVWRVTGKPGKGTTIAVWHQGRLLCVRESYRPGLGLPGGGLRRGEAPEAGARRELFEEVGLALEPTVFSGTGQLAYRNDGRVIEDMLFEIELDVEIPLRIDQREIVWAGFLSPADILADQMQHGTRLYLERVAKRAPALV
jgi:8-oxo-dGTP pyrophosphatase MutT (NUDIX family)